MTYQQIRFPFCVFALCLITLFPALAVAQDAKTMVRVHIDQQSDRYGEIAQTIWDYAEVGYQEVRSSALLQSTLADAGFTIEAGVAEIPTAFVASWGSGHPIIGLLAEFDALPGTSQDRVPVLQQIPGQQTGHACGYHLFGTGSTAAAIAVKEWMEATNTPGTVRLYGTPVYVYHEIVHNKWVVQRFRKLGVVFVDELAEVPRGAHLLYSAHGVSPEVRRSVNRECIGIIAYQQFLSNQGRGDRSEPTVQVKPVGRPDDRL